MKTLVVGAWAMLQAGCEITSDVGSSDAALLTVRGIGQEPFELHFQAEPLRRFVECGTQALAEMDALVQAKVAQGADDSAAPGGMAGARP
jgi:hypothetical protein